MKLIVFAIVVIASSSSCRSLTIQRPHNSALYNSRLSSTRPSLVVCHYTNENYAENNLQDVIKQRRPKRAIPHIQTASWEEEAARAGYIIRQSPIFDKVDANGRYDNGVRRVRPLRVIRRIVLRNGGGRDQLDSAGEIHSLSHQNSDARQLQNFDCDELTEEVMVEIQYRSEQQALAADRSSPGTSRREKTKPNRVTFKSTRQASHSISSMSPTSSSSLTEYMTQPVEQYSLLSFHDMEPPGDSSNPLKARRWLVRRLTTKETQRYMSNRDERTSPENIDNLFRLAVPLQPLIGWDLTPVIDLEVISPQIASDIGESNKECNDHEARMSSKWAPLRGIRGRVGGNSDNFNEAQLPVVKIRSLSVSLLSTQEEVNAAMLEKLSTSSKDQQHHSSKMQEEAIGMVGKIEEWLRPHITFEAELSWNDEYSAVTQSTVNIKSTAVTSLTIPKIPSGILRAAVPPTFFVKRLGATLTSKALEICLPRFLRQLERDYKRWSGIDET